MSHRITMYDSCNGIGWPNFSFDPLKLMPLETAFAHESGLLLGAFTHLTEADRIQLKVEMVSNEAMQ
ncbi:DUF4172 domain-containing protein [Thiothrix lacustris]|uniref:DUF4172 domain-containing protein n=1 Tax=Thiothrix lacustris TaxID=525917 RepID=A0ABY9MTY2_9GAMM|nr:DUF4172 domain-containing protein [Thiothrix lacustris]WML92124.1 DUF4172 domain-containing protein [Thiothrix lacustris]